MNATIRQWINDNVPVRRMQDALRAILEPIGDRYTSQSHKAAGLAIKAGGSALAKTGATAWAGMAYGIPVTVAASTDMPALVGSITAAYFNCYAFFVDQAGTVTSAMGKEGATYADWRFPAFPEKKALLGYIVVTYASTFVGGTTALDTATTIYVDTVGAMNPTVKPY